MSDVYRNFRELCSKEAEGVDFFIKYKDLGTPFVVVGIHGGEIEIGTEEIVLRIAEPQTSYYLFLGTAPRQHITSKHFDEERCVNLVTKSMSVISIHGKRGEEEFVMLGGLDRDRTNSIGLLLQKEGFTVREPEESVVGLQQDNICNRGLSGMGVQVEISGGLRIALLEDEKKMKVFTDIFRSVVVV